MPTPEETAAAAAAAAAKPWHDGKVDAEVLGYMQARGWHDKPANDVALAAINAHREAEKMLGVPKDQLVRLPTAGDEAAQRAFWQKFGTPADVKDYDFPALKDKDGKLADEKMDAAVRNAAFKLNVPKDIAAQLVEAVVKTQSAVVAETSAAAATKYDEGKAELEKTWGPGKFEAFKIVAQEGAKKLGLDPASVDALEKTFGYAKTMEALRRVGAASGEDVFIRGNKDVNDGVLTAEQAADKFAQLKADTEWVKRYTAGGAVEKREFETLTRLIAAAKPVFGT